MHTLMKKKYYDIKREDLGYVKYRRKEKKEPQIGVKMQLISHYKVQSSVHLELFSYSQVLE